MPSCLPCACAWLWTVVSLVHGADPAAPGSPALRAWERGQQALQAGRYEDSLSWYETSLRLDPDFARAHLGLAAAQVALGQDEQAALHLQRYVEARPGHAIVRAHYAELLLRLGRVRDARSQLEQFAADAQEHDDLAREHLVGCHSRLAEIAEGADDAYGEHLHRGIGLYLLARKRAALPEPEGELGCEGLLCRAAGELALARLERPDQARPCWYLYEVWSQLAQQQPAHRWLRAAEEAALTGDLTPAEQRSLRLAWRRVQEEGWRK